MQDLTLDRIIVEWFSGPMATKLTDLKLTPTLLDELRQRGYETAEDMAHLSIAESLRIPGVGGRDWRKIAAAQGREPHTATSRRP